MSIKTMQIFICDEFHIHQCSLITLLTHQLMQYCLEAWSSTVSQRCTEVLLVVCFFGQSSVFSFTWALVHALHLYLASKHTLMVPVLFMYFFFFNIYSSFMSTFLGPPLLFPTSLWNGLFVFWPPVSISRTLFPCVHFVFYFSIWVSSVTLYQENYRKNIRT